MDTSLPHDTDIERSILASVIVYPDTAGEIFENLTPADFYETRHALIFRVAQTLHIDGHPSELTAIVSRLRELGELEKAGGAAYIAGLRDFPVPTSNAYYCQKLKELSERRRLTIECNATMQDACDLSKSIDDVHKRIESAAAGADAARQNRIPTTEELAISDIEWNGATLAPDCIVENYLYADVGLLAAPGGTGKTTLWLWEAAHIVLGRPLYGLKVRKPGRCLLVTAEDPRPVLIARLRKISGAMGLSPSEIDAVRNGVLIYDVSGLDKKLVELKDGNVTMAVFADEIVSGYRDDPPVLSTLDPAISFGVGETRINENEQGLVSAARRIRNGLGCCVRYIHHVGKQNARDKALDQYASRGGSALPDGCRMVAVLQAWDPRDNTHRPPQGLNYSPDASVMLLARPKLSYAPANPPLIWIRRSGWMFEHFTEVYVSDEMRDQAALNQVERFVAANVKRGVYHNKTSFQSAFKEMSLPRDRVRDITNLLMAAGRLVETDLPKDKQSTKRKTYLSPVSQDSAGFAKQPRFDDSDDADEPPKNKCGGLKGKTPAALFGGGVIPHSLDSAADIPQDSAGFAGLDENEQAPDRWEVEI